MLRFVPFLAVVCAAFVAAPVKAQVSASSSKPLSLFAYATATGIEDEQSYGKSLGEGGGFYLQHSRFVALDFRGYIVRERQPLHTYLGEVGPRFSYRVWRVRPYGEVLGGLGHSGYGRQPMPLRGAYGAAWSVDGGADLRLTHRFEWRVADVNYSHIYAGPGVSPIILSTGVVFRIF